MKKHILSGFLALSSTSLLYTSGVFAQNLVDVYQKARIYAPEYQVKSFALEAIRSKSNKVRAGYLPSVDLDASYAYSWQEVLSSESTNVIPINETDYATNSVSLTIRQKLYDGALLAQMNKSRYELNQSQLQYRASEQLLMFKVAETYFSVLSAEDQLTLTQAEERAIKSEYDLITLKYQQGIANLLDWQDIQSRFAEARANVAQAQMGVRAAKYALKQLTGEDNFVLDKLRSSFTETSISIEQGKNYLEAAYENNLDIKAQREAISTAKQEVRVQTRGHHPTIDLTLSASREDAEGSLYGGGNDISDYKARVSLNVPIFKGGSTLASTDEARQQLKIQKTLLTQIKDQIDSEVNMAIYGMESSLIKIDSMKTSLRAYEVSLQAKRSGYRSNLFTSLDVLDAESKVYFAKKMLSASLYELILHYLKLKQLTGELNEQELEALTQWLVAA